MKICLVTLILLIALQGQLQADTAYFEDFEDAVLAAPAYVVAPPDDLDAVAVEDYWGRISESSTAWQDNDYSYLGHLGDGFYGASDTDSVNGGTGPDNITMDITGINISNFINMEFSLYLAEDDDGTNEDWDQTTSFRVLRQIDNGGFVFMIGVESSDDSAGNKEPAIDTNGDGFGDGAKVTDTFTQYTIDLSAFTGSTMDIKIEFEDLDTGDEDIAFDNLFLEGDFTGVPEPTAMLLFTVGLGICAGRRRRK
jgi:hypothetical protein